MTSIAGLNSSGFIKAQQLVDMQKQMSDLSLQLSSGKIAQDYGGLGINRGLDVNVRGALSRLNSYTDVITTVNTRVQLQDTSLTRLNTIAQDMRSNTLPPFDFTLVANGQTNVQLQAASSLDEAVSLLNQRAGNTYLFSGSASDTPAADTADHILNGNGAAAGLKQVVSERLQADMGSDGRGRLDPPSVTGSAVKLTEEDSGPFGFKIASASTSVAGATVSGPAGSPPSLTVDLAGNNPVDGDTVQLRLNLPDGTSKTITLTATTDTPVPDGSFAIGATAADTAANLAGAMDTQIQKSAQVDLQASSAIEASNNFFDTDADHPAQRVDGPPFDSASALRDSTATDTVKWYTGDDATNDPLSTMSARVDDSITVNYGIRGNEEALRNVVKNFATLAAVSFSASDPNADDRYTALATKIGNSLAPNSTTQQISAIQTQIAGANLAAGAAQTRIKDKAPILQGVLDGIENADPNETGVKLLALQTQIQASLQTTSMLSKLTLVNFMS
jgi:flagellin-like hook-associated protein FlgL